MSSLVLLRSLVLFSVVPCVWLSAQSKAAPEVSDLELLVTSRRELVTTKDEKVFGWIELTIESGKIGDQEVYQTRSRDERLNYQALRTIKVDWVSVRTQDLKLIYFRSVRRIGNKKTVTEIHCDDAGFVTVIKDKKRKRAKLEHRPDARLTEQILVKGVEPFIDREDLVFRLVNTDTLKLEVERSRYVGKQRVKVNGKSVAMETFETSYMKLKNIKTSVDADGDIARVDFAASFHQRKSKDDTAVLRERMRSYPVFLRDFAAKIRKGWQSKGQAIGNDAAGLKMRLPKGFKRRKLSAESDNAIVLDLYGGKYRFVYQILLGLHYEELSLKDLAESYAKSREGEKGFAVDAMEDVTFDRKPAVRLDFRAEIKGRTGFYSMLFVANDGLLYRFLLGANGSKRSKAIPRKLLSMQKSVKFLGR